MTYDKKALPPEVRKYFQEIGRMRGNALKERYGSEYFRKIAAMRKTFGAQGKIGSGTYQDLANTYGVSKQRLQQIVKKYGDTLDKSAYADEKGWRQAVIKKYFDGRG